MREILSPCDMFGYEPDRFETPFELELIERIENAEHYFDSVVDILFGNAPFDEERLRFCLEDMAKELDAKMPEGSLKITERRNMKFNVRDIEQLSWQLMSTVNSMKEIIEEENNEAKEA